MAPRAWPANESLPFVPVLLAAYYVPLLAMLGAGTIPARSLLIWVAVAGFIIAGLTSQWTRSRGPVERLLRPSYWNR